MSSFLLVLFVLAMLVAFVGYFWLIAQACHKSAKAGLCMIYFAPVAAPMAAIQEWTEWKKPIFVYLGGCSAQILLILMLLVTDNPVKEMLAALKNGDFARNQALQAIAELESKGQLNEEEKAQLAMLKAFLASEGGEFTFDEDSLRDSTAEPDTAVIDQMLSAQSTTPAPVAPVRQLRPRLTKITVNKAAGHVGKEVRVVAKDGRMYSGTLTRAKRGRIWVEFYMGAGTAELEFRADQIESLKVMI